LVDCVGVIGIDFGVVIEFVDCVLLGKLVSIVDEVICVFEVYDYMIVFEVSECFFWDFCDDYVELVKEWVYGELGDLVIVLVRVVFVIVLYV